MCLDGGSTDICLETGKRNIDRWAELRVSVLSIVLCMGCDKVVKQDELPRDPRGAATEPGDDECCGDIDEARVGANVLFPSREVRAVTGVGSFLLHSPFASLRFSRLSCTRAL